MFCKNCGKDIDIKSRTCPYCGEETDFLPGVDGEKKPDHIAEFEEELQDIRTNQPGAGDDIDDEYEDISSYRTGKVKEDKNIKNNVSDHVTGEKSVSKKDKDNEPADENGVKIWRILMIICIVVIVISLIIIVIAQSNKNKAPEDIATPDTAVSTTVGSTVTYTTGDKKDSTTPSSTVKGTDATEKTSSTTATQPTTTGSNKSIQEYLAEAVPNDSAAVANAQTLYADLEAACAGGDFDKFKTFFNSTYSESDIKSIYDEYHSKCADYSSFVVGFTHTVSCSDYTYVYIAATTNLETQEYVENTFVLTSDGKLDQSENGKAWLAQAANIV